MNSVLLIEKYHENGLFWPNLMKKKKISDLSVKEVLNNYQGFEGDLISILPLDEQNVEFCKKTKEKNTLLCTISNSINIPPFIKNWFVFAGYDFGICENEKTLYSSIFNEILFGSISKLISWKDKLNNHFLFETILLTEEYFLLHHQLLLEGWDVEDDDDMNIYQVWTYSE
jgi:hypothetical protein